MAVSGVPAAAAASLPGPRRLGVVTDERITESSGLVASPTHRDLMWTVDDSGSSARVFGVSATSGRTVAVLTLADTQARDWEAMTATTARGGRGLLWIGDVGDNRSVRDSVVLRLVTEPRTVTSETVRPVSLRVRYPDGAHDVEAMLWTRDGRLLLVSKRLFSGTVYQVPPAAVAAALAGRSTATPATAVVLGTVAQSLVTDGAALPDGRVVLRGYEGAVVYGEPEQGQSLHALADVALPPQPQGETLAVVEDGAAAIVGSEGQDQPLWRVALPAPLRAASGAPSGSASGASGGSASAAPGSAASVTSAPASAAPARAAPASAAPTSGTTGGAEAPAGDRRSSLELAALGLAALASLALLLAVRRRDATSRRR